MSIAKHKKIYLDFEVDKLSNSIENVLTGEIFDTEIVRLTLLNYKQIKKVEWQFDWTIELEDKTKEVYKLTTKNNPNIIHGLLSIQDYHDHIFIHLIESSNFNKGRNKVYLGVPGNLVAYACKVSFDKSYDGYVAFDAKSVLIKHYEQTLGAKYFRGLRMYIDTIAALRLISKYY